MTTYKDFPIKGFDVSHWNDNNDTKYFPTFDKLIERGFRFVGIRTSYGVVTDGDFIQYWAQAKGKLARIPYHYLDFYSHDAMNISDEEWGKRQAIYVKNLLKNDPGEFPLFLDVENSSRYKITSANQSKVGRIINAFLNEYGEAGIYTNQGYLFVFGQAHRTRPLWFSWYNRTVTIERINKVLADNKWTGKLLIFQYTSDGDIDDDGVSDARSMGMESNSLDLNRFVGTEAEYTKYDVGVPISEDEPIDKYADLTDAERFEIMWEDFIKRQAS